MSNVRQLALDLKKETYFSLRAVTLRVPESNIGDAGKYDSIFSRHIISRAYLGRRFHYVKGIAVVEILWAASHLK